MNYFDESFRLKLNYRIALALIFFGVALFCRFTFMPQNSGTPFVTFYPAIILSFYFCGPFSGCLVALLSGFAGAYYFIPPYNQLAINSHIPTNILFFTITSVLIGISINQRRNIEQLNTILDNEMVGSMMLKNRKILWCNKAMSSILGYAQSDLVGSSTRKLFAESAIFDEVGRDAYPLKKGVPYRKQFEMRKADGNNVWVDVCGSTVSYDPNMSLWLINDVSELKRLELKLKNQVDHDYLTGLYTREWFVTQSELELNRSVRYGSSLSLMMIDIDFFKRINDSYGHQAGDQVLKGFADICRDSLRGFDICGRLGGEEFCILLPETDPDSAILVAERLRLVIESREILAQIDSPINITVSIGVTSLASKDDTVTVLIGRADKALYQAKNTGRNRVCSF